MSIERFGQSEGQHLFPKAGEEIPRYLRSDLANPVQLSFRGKRTLSVLETPRHCHPIPDSDARGPWTPPLAP